jgi:hypothetical protein
MRVNGVKMTCTVFSLVCVMLCTAWLFQDTPGEAYMVALLLAHTYISGQGKQGWRCRHLRCTTTQGKFSIPPCPNDVACPERHLLGSMVALLLA